MGDDGLSRVERIIGRLGIVPDRKRGRRLWALCPFHRDRHAENWFIRHIGRRRGQHHCFSCKAGGSLLDLVMHVRRCSETKAQAWLDDFEDDAPPPPANRVRMNIRSPLASGFEVPPECIEEPFDEWVTPARDYARSRGITRAQVKRWRIGYAVFGKRGGRLMFIARDQDGVPGTYSARTFIGAEKRYLTPSEYENADLDVMFGEEHWPAALEDRRLVVLVEGAINGLAVERALALAKIDGHFAVIGGSHLRPAHAMKLATFARVILLTDPDAAGDDVSEAYVSALARHVHVDRVRLPSKQDAQSLPRKALAELLWHSFTSTTAPSSRSIGKIRCVRRAS